MRIILALSTIIAVSSAAAVGNSQLHEKHKVERKGKGQAKQSTGKVNFAVEDYQPGFGKQIERLEAKLSHWCAMGDIYVLTGDHRQGLRHSQRKP